MMLPTEQENNACVLKFFLKKGVDLQAPKQAFYGRYGPGLLVIRATADDLDNVKRILESLNCLRDLFDTREVIQAAKLHYEEGKLDDAETIINGALEQDPTNAEAHYYLKQIEQTRSEREKGITNVPPPIRPMPIPAVEASTTRLLKIFLLTVDTGLPRFRHETGLAAASSSDDYLAAFAKMLAADGAILPTNCLWLGDQGFLLVRGTPVELEPVENMMQNLNGFPSHQKRSHSTTQTVVPPVADTNLFMRTFKANGDVFYVSVQKASGEVPPPERKELSGVLRDLFGRLGVDLTPPKAVFFNDRLGLLFVKDTGTDLEVVERVMESLNQPPQASADGENPDERNANATAGGATPTRASNLAANVPAKLVYTGPGRHEIVRKLDAIRLDVAYDDLPLREVLRNLSAQTRKLDPEQSGINFLINPNTDTADTANSSPAPGTVDLGATLVNLKLENVRLADVLDAIMLVADHPLQYSIQDFGIVFSLRTPRTEALFMRTFKVDPDTFGQGLEGVGSASFGGTGNTSGSGGGAGNGSGAIVPVVNIPPGAGPIRSADSVDYNQSFDAKSPRHRTDEMGQEMRKFFEEKGVLLTAPKSLFYNDRLGLLFVRASKSDLDKIERALSALKENRTRTTVQPGFNITSPTGSKSPGLNWYLPGSPTPSPSPFNTGQTSAPTVAAMAGVLVNPNFQVVIDALARQ
jgi:hypothetical protein